MPPVHDAPVHELVKIAAAKPYGCSNATRKDHYFTFTHQMVEDRMTRLCRHDQRKSDPRCYECTRESDIEWLRSYGLL